MSKSEPMDEDVGKEDRYLLYESWDEHKCYCCVDKMITFISFLSKGKREGTLFLSEDPFSYCEFVDIEDTDEFLAPYLRSPLERKAGPEPYIDERARGRFCEGRGKSPACEPLRKEICIPALQKRLYEGLSFTVSYDDPVSKKKYEAKGYGARNIKLHDVRFSNHIAMICVEGKYYHKREHGSSRLPAGKLPEWLRIGDLQSTTRLQCAIIKQLIQGDSPRHIAQGYGISRRNVEALSTAIINAVRDIYVKSKRIKSSKRLHLKEIGEEFFFGRRVELRRAVSAKKGKGTSGNSQSETVYLVFHVDENGEVSLYSGYSSQQWKYASVAASAASGHSFLSMSPSEQRMLCEDYSLVLFSVPIATLYSLLMQCSLACRKSRELHRISDENGSFIETVLEGCLHTIAVEKAVSTSDMTGIMYLILGYTENYYRIERPVRSVIRYLERLRRYYHDSDPPPDAFLPYPHAHSHGIVDKFLDNLRSSAERCTDDPISMINRLLYLNEAAIPLHPTGDDWEYDPTMIPRLPNAGCGVPLHCLNHLLENGFLDPSRLLSVPCSSCRFLVQAGRNDNPPHDQVRIVRGEHVVKECNGKHNCPWFIGSDCAMDNQ